MLALLSSTSTGVLINVTVTTTLVVDLALHVTPSLTFVVTLKYSSLLFVIVFSLINALTLVSLFSTTYVTVTGLFKVKLFAVMLADKDPSVTVPFTSPVVGVALLNETLRS